jgi:multidrug transporter EmrE-like cation transporter
MITLGFCSALTHSLLNAGKRVFAIVMAIVWFRESFSRATAVGLALVFCGGCWYTTESKTKQQQKQPNASSSRQRIVQWFKPMVAFVLLQSVYMIHALDTMATDSSYTGR